MTLINDILRPSDSFISLLAKNKIVSPKELKNIAEAIWTAVGVVSALMATISASNLNSGYIDVMDDIGSSIFILLSYVSLVLHIFCIVTIAIAWTGVEFCIDDDIYAFLGTFGFLGTLPAILFTFGTILGVISFLPLIYVISNTVVFIISCITIGIALFLCVQLFESIKKFYWDKANKYLIKNKTNKIRPSDETGDDN